MFEKPNVLYTAEATATGGRQGVGTTLIAELPLDLRTS